LLHTGTLRVGAWLIENALASSAFILTVAGHHWIGPDEAQDVCSHGLVSLSIGGVRVLEREDLCTSAAALRLLRSLDEDVSAQTGVRGERMIPCCGRSLVYDARGRVEPMGCPNGATFGVEHLTLGGGAAVRISDVNVRTGSERPIAVEAVCLPLAEYASQVRAFATDVLRFYDHSPARRPDPDAVFPGCETACLDMWDEIGHLAVRR
jgi:hypothetical protein